MWFTCGGALILLSYNGFVVPLLHFSTELHVETWRTWHALVKRNGGVYLRLHFQLGYDFKYVLISKPEKHGTRKSKVYIPFLATKPQTYSVHDLPKQLHWNWRHSPTWLTDECIHQDIWPTAASRRIVISRAANTQRPLIPVGCYQYTQRSSTNTAFCKGNGSFRRILGGYI